MRFPCHSRPSRFAIAALLSIALTAPFATPANADPTWATVSSLTGPTGSGTFANTSQDPRSITVLANGNIVVTDTGFDDGVTSNVGAVYLYSGTTFEALQTLKGSRASDAVGSSIVTLDGSSNFVVVSPNWDNGGTANVGAATWVNGTTGAIVGSMSSTNTVSATNSFVGLRANDGTSLKSFSLSNGNYIAHFPKANRLDVDGCTNTGAVAWGNGSTGSAGALSSSNSLFGNGCSDWIGSGNETESSKGITILNNGNYVVSSPFANVGGTDWGSVTWCNGATSGTRCTGPVSTANSLHGTTNNDLVGTSGVTALANGNYVVRSDQWNNGGNADAGAVTWCSGTSGCTGAVSASNSLVGSSATDYVGNRDILELSNGNYIVRSFQWNNGGNADAGAVTWCSGTSSCTGPVSASNSLVGSTTQDYVGGNEPIALTNGNYVIPSPSWDGTAAGVGAVTWCSGTSGCIGAVSAANSLVGSTASDGVGNTGLTALSNGNYVVLSQDWDNGAVTNVGAVTWCSGTSGCTGAVTTSNSLHGSTSNDIVGNAGVSALNNGNYVVRSQSWDNSTVTDVGAITWCSGTSGCTGAVTTSNSLHGSATTDQLGSESITSLTNGNYVVRYMNWDNGAIANVGAIRWCSGTSGCAGTVSITNSLHGASASDEIGSSRVISLDNGHYIVVSPNFDFGSSSNVGAITWCDGTAGCTGAVTTSNSLHGSSNNDKIGHRTTGSLLTHTTLTDGVQEGNVLFSSPAWDNNTSSTTLTDAGAITLFNTSTAGPRTVGPINGTNSVVGAAPNMLLGDRRNLQYDPVNDLVYVHNADGGNSLTVLSLRSTATTTTTSGGSPAPTTTATTTTSTTVPRNTVLGPASRLVISEFAERSARLTPELRRQARNVLRTHPAMTSVECKGFVKTGDTANARQIKLANDRARVVCSYLKSLRPNLETTVSRGSATSDRRRVRLIIRS